MRVFVDTMLGATFTFDDLNHRSKLSEVKKQIENSHGIPVSAQKLFFNGVELLVDYQLVAYGIRHNSCLLLVVRGDHVNNQMPQQSLYATQGFVPFVASSSYDQVPPSHANASFFNQDPRTIARSNQVPPPSHASTSFLNQDPRTIARSNHQVLPPSHASESFYYQDPRPMSRNNQVLPSSHASEYFLNQDPRTIAGSNQVPPPSHASESFYYQDPRTMPMSNQVFHQTQISPVPPSHASASFYNQDPRTMAMSNQVFHQTQISPVPPSHSSASFYTQDLLVSNDGQVPHQPDVLESFSMDEFRERAPLPWTAQETREMEGIWHGTTGEKFNLQESSRRANRNQDLSPPPQKLTVRVRQYNKPGGDFMVEVNASDNVGELRKQLEKYQVDLPAEGYFFGHKKRVLAEEKSFSMNRVADGDTIEIFPEPNIQDFYT